MQTHPVKNLAVADDLRVADGVLVELLVDFQNAGNRAHARQHAILLGQNGGSSALLWINTRARGCVAGGPVLQQPVLQDGTDPSSVPIHVLPSLTQLIQA